MGAPLQSPTQAEQDFARAFAGAAPVGEARAAFERFSGAGLPSRRVESWHYTDLRAKLRAAPPTARAPDAKAIAAARAKIPDSYTLKIVTIDGFFVPELSSGLSGLAGVTLSSFSGDPAKASDPLLDLNSAFAPSGFLLDIAAGARIDKTLEIFALAGSDPARARFGRGLVTLGPGAKAGVIETRAEAAEGFADSVLTVVLAAGAELDYACRCETSAAVEVQNFIARVDEGAQLRVSALIAGRALSAPADVRDLRGRKRASASLRRGAAEGPRPCRHDAHRDP